MMKIKLHDDRAGLAVKLRGTPPAWPLRMAAAAVAVTLGGYSPAPVHALGLGRITVLSALGEPLRAEIAIPQITAEEAASLKAAIPPSATFRAAGVEYNAALASARIALQRSPDGRFALQLSSDKVVTEPFVDLILEASWSSGRIVRDYTLLFDPPSLREAAPPAPVAAQVPQTSIARTPTAPPPASSPSVGPATSPRPTPAKAVAAPPTPATRPAAATLDNKQVKVHVGDTAGRIALGHKPEGISLDQMLVAMLRANPDAFIEGNVNRIKAGALLDLPSAAQASSVSQDDARKVLSVQSTSFNEFRRRLAVAAPAKVTAGPDRQTSGSLQTRVEDKKPASVSPDKLTLSKGAATGQAPEAKIAASRQKQVSAERVAELSRNVSELSNLKSSAGTAAPAAGATRPASAAAPATVTVPTAAKTPPAAATATVATAAATSASKPASSAPPAKTAASANVATSALATATAGNPASSTMPPASAAAASASSAAVAASKPVLSASSPRPAAAAMPPAAEPTFLDDLLENPLVPAAALGLLALLGGFGFYRLRQTKSATQVDSSFLESKLQPDSFFGSSGGERIDTNETAPTGASSMAYSPSQLDAAGDVDPVAEADVYLAYGRDLQAEEILREALKGNPARVAIHEKLLEIYAKRRDVRAFDVAAGEARKLTGGVGAEWERICEFGRSIDGGNPLYTLGGGAQVTTAEEGGKLPQETSAQAFGTSTMPVMPHPAQAAPVGSMPIDLDLGDLDAPPESTPTPVFDATRTVVTTAHPQHDSTSLEWEAISAPDPTASSAAAKPTSGVAPAAPDLSASAGDAPESASKDPGMIEFDLDSLSLDLEQSEPMLQESRQPQGDVATDPMETKLALAQEFHAIGDADGARALVEEVVAGTTGPLKAKAQRFLTELG